MIVDARQLEPGAALETDLAVVGGGAAGISIARELSGRGLDIVLLESGGYSYEQNTQALYMGEESGTLIGASSVYLAASRLRYFGGSTNHWQGWCRPLDPEVFTGREWIDPDGWPISRGDLDPFYLRAAELAQITPFDYEDSSLDRPNDRFLMRPGSQLDTTFFHLSPPTRFGTAYRNELEAARDLRVLLYANVTQIEVTADARRAEALEIACLDGPRFRVRARAFVLGTGAIENARLLLASNRVQGEGLGNGHDLVGRYFMDHPGCRAGYLLASSPHRSVDKYTASVLRRRGRTSHRARGVLRASAELQRTERIGESLIVLTPLLPTERPPLTPAMADVATDLIRLASRDPDLARKVDIMGVDVVTEPIPRSASRVDLATERDALDMPRTRLRWELGEEDAAHLHRVAELLAREMSWRMHGRVNLLSVEQEPWARARWNNHHMGTTRMHPDPSRGVVDADCRVHGVDNLYVAGSSVFPTAGASNPTFTILALALRLADHLAERLRA